MIITTSVLTVSTYTLTDEERTTLSNALGIIKRLERKNFTESSLKDSIPSYACNIIELALKGENLPIDITRELESDFE